MPREANRLLFASIAVAVSMPAHAASCEVAEMLSGQLRFDIAAVVKIPGKYPPRKGGEYAIIRRSSHTPILGELHWDQSGEFFIYNYSMKRLAYIASDLVTPADDACAGASRLVIRSVRPGVYDILEGNKPVGRIEGRFPKPQ